MRARLSSAKTLDARRKTAAALATSTTAPPPADVVDTATHFAVLTELCDLLAVVTDDAAFGCAASIERAWLCVTTIDLSAAQRRCWS